MNSFANVLFTLFFGWLKTAAASLYQALMRPESGTLLTFVGENWKIILLALLIAGTILDLTVYFFRWRPHVVWASFFRRITGRKKDDLPFYDTAANAVNAPYVGPDHVLQREPDQLVYVDPHTQPELDADTEMDPEMASDIVMNLNSSNWENTEIVRKKRAGNTRKRVRPGSLVRWMLASETGEMDLSPLRASRVQPAMDARDAYHDPYIPPQWQKPEEKIVRKKRSGREKV